MANTIKGMGIMLNKASCQLMFISTRVTPISISAFTITSGMAWAINCSIKSESLTARDINWPVCLSS
jgi:hypothetical protein